MPVWLYSAWVCSVQVTVSIDFDECSCRFFTASLIFPNQNFFTTLPLQICNNSMHLLNSHGSHCCLLYPSLMRMISIQHQVFKAKNNAPISPACDVV
ncbi:hypothetical protein Rcae01_03030 [Novipirellula caenicola]|uniref:Secreted protein n=1 Tax=Novipirellula caenicola TaxID=1536901 RepID=A0ABP9VQY4_9BACT